MNDEGNGSKRLGEIEAQLALVQSRLDQAWEYAKHEPVGLSTYTVDDLVHYVAEAGVKRVRRKVGADTFNEFVTTLNGLVSTLRTVHTLRDQRDAIIAESGTPGWGKGEADA